MTLKKGALRPQLVSPRRGGGWLLAGWTGGRFGAAAESRDARRHRWQNNLQRNKSHDETSSNIVHHLTTRQTCKIAVGEPRDPCRGSVASASLLDAALPTRRKEMRCLRFPGWAPMKAADLLQQESIQSSFSTACRSKRLVCHNLSCVPADSVAAATTAVEHTPINCWRHAPLSNACLSAPSVSKFRSKWICRLSTGQTATWYNNSVS